MVAVIIGIIVATSGGGGGKKQSTQASGGEIFLEPSASQGTDPFTQTVAMPTPSPTVPPDAPINIGPTQTAPKLPAGGAPTGGGTPAITPVSGGTPGLYGGTQNQSSCDSQKLIDFLTANPDKGRAWAAVEGISQSDIGSYIRSLTPVILRSDTRVTNHGFSNGRATPLQSVLQAGTAVLVDNRGVPRARCACGNPLLPPTPVQTGPTYSGPAWPGFNPSSVTVINQSTTVINVITVINITTGTPFGLPPGPNGQPVPLPGAGTTLPPRTTTTRPPTNCAGSQGGSLLETLTIDSRQAQTVTSRTYPAGRCYRVVFSGEVDQDTGNTFQGGFDTHYCYDPRYCSTPTLRDGSFDVNGQRPWVAFGQQPPAFSQTHTYSYSVNGLPSNQLTVTFNDTNYSDNQGAFAVQIFG